MRWGRRLLRILLILLPFCLTMASPTAARQQASIVVDHASGTVLSARSADEPAIPASLTKMMTLYLTFQALAAGQIDLSSRLKISARAAAMPPTKLGLRAGETIRVEDAILGLVTRSANDAASVLAEGLGGSEDRFAQAMTRTARKLGMTRTVFRNASGLPNAEQRSTARDLAKLASQLIKDYPGYYRYFASRSFAYRGRNFANHNRLLGVYPGMDGLKTGYTRASGFNLAASAVRGNRRLVAVVIGGRTAAARDAVMVELLDRAFERIRKGLPTEAVAAATPTPPAAAPREIVVASLSNRASDAIEAIPVARPKPAARSTAKKSPATLSRASSQPVAKAKPARGGSGYGVQVGAFRASKQARAAVELALKGAPELLRGTKASVAAQPTSKGTLFKATLHGLSRSDADAACARLRQRKQDCMVVSGAPAKVASR